MTKKCNHICGGYKVNLSGWNIPELKVKIGERWECHLLRDLKIININNVINNNVYPLSTYTI